MATNKRTFFKKQIKKDIKMYTNDDIFEIIRIHLYEMYHSKIGNMERIQRNSNWYTDLGLDSFDRAEFYTWIEEKFAVRFSFLHCTTVGAISSKIYEKLPEKYKSGNIQQISFLQRIKQKFVKTK